MVSGMKRLLWIACAAVLCTSGCKSESKPTPKVADAGAPSFQSSGRRPVNPTRQAPPPTIASALAIGARAPDVDLPVVRGESDGRFHLAEALAKERALLVFYRGDW
jgi:hypothetical protein